ncbi:hypothetical protein GXP67_08960 [Rhodocytophaga rosea]|uniref:DUF3575 domain-containing protein n=1 Tax=Rhodocytophaga rosea TaxID=2704465 RepID=A0A6C0GFL7_9BACT|nr:hypothetical protein [Rhodocytophaga rosea]QHT66778.1 hypothetical protein GXP67_08960 [Rhodocytophaga rosea]
MKKKLIGLVMACCLTFCLLAQTDSGKSYHNFPIIVTLQFHSLTLPFKDIKTNFANIGIGLGTEVSLNGKPNWVQQLQVLWFRNKAAGNGIFFYTQTAWRPAMASYVYSELKAGAGYMLAFHPVESYKPVNGKWEPVGRIGKGMLAFPVGVSVGYHDSSSQTNVSPFASYQFLLLTDYNKSITLIPQTLVQVGTRIHPNY